MLLTKEKRGLICENLSRNEFGELCFAGMELTPLARKYGTPLMLLDEARIRANMQAYKNAMRKYFGEKSTPLYASKALSFTAMYQIAAQEGIYTDIVSIGELYTAIKAGFNIENAFFHGNAQSDSDIAYSESIFLKENKQVVSIVGTSEKSANKLYQKIVLLFYNSLRNLDVFHLISF